MLSYCFCAVLFFVLLFLIAVDGLIFGYVIRQYWYRTPRERENRSPPDVDYGMQFPSHLFVFLLGMSYATV